jgi:hypothetical protein
LGARAPPRLKSARRSNRGGFFSFAHNYWIRVEPGYARSMAADDDDLAPARGIANGVWLGFVLWCVVGLAVWLIVWLIRG